MTRPDRQCGLPRLPTCGAIVLCMAVECMATARVVADRTLPRTRSRSELQEASCRTDGRHWSARAVVDVHERTAARPSNGGLARRLVQYRDWRGVVRTEGPKELWNEVTRLLVVELARSYRVLAYVAKRLENDRGGKVRESVVEARRIVEEVHRGLRWLRDVQWQWQELAPYLSLVKVRIVRAVPHGERAMEGVQDPIVRGLGGLLGRVMSGLVDIEARVLEVHTVGRAYLRGSIRARLHPRRKRKDLRVGATIPLDLNAYKTGIWITKDDEGQDYWLLIGPSAATKAIPRLAGVGGRSSIFFALRARRR